MVNKDLLTIEASVLRGAVAFWDATQDDATMDDDDQNQRTSKEARKIY
jgi:hypothetical protein